MTDARRQLIRYLNHLTATEYPVYAHELMLPEEASRLLYEAHERACCQVCLLAEQDEAAASFKRQVYDSITRPYGGLYDSADVLRAARQLAPRTLKRLQAEEAKIAAEARHDPVGHAQRNYIRERAEYDPFALDANLQVSGLPEILQRPVRLNSDGSISADF